MDLTTTSANHESYLEERADNAPSVFLGALCERDIDLLILEEVWSSPDFFVWLCRKMAISEDRLDLLEARVSTLEASGESDIELWLKVDNNQTVALLLENKIDALFQPKQAARYVARGKAYVAQGRCASFRTAIVAPENYLDRSTEARAFEHRISYESLLSWFLERPDAQSNSRTGFKICQLERAIGKALEGYCRIEDAQVSAFWNGSHALLASLAPELLERQSALNQRSGKPARAIWFRFRVVELGPKFQVIYKTDKGFVDFQIPGRSKEQFALTPLLKPHLEDGMSVCATGQALVVRTEVPKTFPNLPFEDQREQLVEAFLVTERVFDWIRSKRSILQNVFGLQERAAKSRTKRETTF